MLPPHLYYTAGYPKELSNTDQAWLRLAVKVAHQSQERHRHGAVIVLGGSVHAVGFNSQILDPAYYAATATKFSVHAEEAALAKLDVAKRGILYVARINNAGETRMSKPCPACETLIRTAGIKRVVWTV